MYLIQLLPEHTRDSWTRENLGLCVRTAGRLLSVSNAREMLLHQSALVGYEDIESQQDEEYASLLSPLSQMSAFEVPVGSNLGLSPMYGHGEYQSEANPDIKVFPSSDLSLSL